ncbi:MAG TPA: phage holin family protein [Candidatus Avirikenella pullistercoris]|nr:phage holin family protein [Candidatus Avirikenella pullistercoris]
MKNGDEMNRVEQTAADATDYVLLQLDKFKLRLLDNLATLFNTVFGVIVIMVLLSFVVMFLGIAATWGLAELIGSLVGATLIMASVFLIAAILVYAFRKKLIINPVVRMLSKIMFETDKDADYE